MSKSHRKSKFAIPGINPNDPATAKVAGEKAYRKTTAGRKMARYEARRAR